VLVTPSSFGRLDRGLKKSLEEMTNRLKGLDCCMLISDLALNTQIVAFYYSCILKIELLFSAFLHDRTARLRNRPDYPGRLCLIE
jgi:hypothetical protein